MSLRKPLSLALALLLLLSLSGCSTLTASSDTATADPATGGSQPFFPSGIYDIQIPAELEMNRNESMFINTASYAGGVLVYDGRVDIASLADFFETTMKKNGWTLAGSIRYKNVLLAFIKPNKSCIVKVVDAGVAFKTKLSIYLTQDSTVQGNGQNSDSGLLIR
ncbi:MAG: hypothetical protein AB1568_08960 [Thermodesulfobacteriota bacterium]